MDASAWPHPVEVINEHGRTPFVLVCEHASNYIPAEYRGLGLDAADLTRHIAWDIGAAALTRSLARQLDAPAFLGTYSRLLIDLNRPPRSTTSIPQRSESTEIIGNCGIDAVEREKRVQRIFEPFHARLAACVHARESDGMPIAIIAIHSFTPVFFGQPRPWHAGILYEKGITLGKALIANLRSDASLNVDANVPYTVSPEDDYALLVHGDDRDHPAVLIEIRNDLLTVEKDIERWAQRLEAALIQSWR